MLSIIPSALFLVMLVAIAVVDLRRRKIHNWEIGVLVVIWLVWATFVIVPEVSRRAGFIGAASVPFPITGVSMVESLMAALLFGGGSLMLTLVFEFLSGRFAFGGGDIKLLFACGLFLGIEGEAIALLIACATCALCGVVVSRMRRQPAKDDSGCEQVAVSSAAKGGGASLSTSLPFGPFIAIGCIVSLMLLLF